jgi:glycosyltransferase involved in cell wall biosynthesis
MFERAASTVRYPVEWVVVDDGQEAFDPGGCNYYRREPDGPNSLGRNVLFGLPKCQGDIVLFWEDDDWYAPERIEVQVNALKDVLLHGWCRTWYYNVPNRCHFQFHNLKHASLFETGLRKELIPSVMEIVRGEGDNPFIDMAIWKRLKGRLEPFTGVCVGIKGAPGRKGLGSGRTQATMKGWTEDPRCFKLFNLVGRDDGQWYIDNFKDAKLLHQARHDIASVLNLPVSSTLAETLKEMAVTEAYHRGIKEQAVQDVNVTTQGAQFIVSIIGEG